MIIEFYESKILFYKSKQQFLMILPFQYEFQCRKRLNVLKFIRISKLNLQLKLSQMIRPIQFRKSESIDLNLLKLELDRRVDLISMMVKGFKTGKSCSDSCCKLQDNFCQTQDPCLPLSDLKNIPQSNKSSLKSLKSPATLKKQSKSKKNKQNQVSRSSKQLSNKQVNIKLLRSIQQTDTQALKTSRYHKQLQSQKKNQKKSILNQSNKAKNVSKKVNVQKCYTNANVLKSFDSSKKSNFSTERKYMPTVFCENSTQDNFINLSLSGGNYTESCEKSQVKRRKNSINDISFVINLSNNCKYDKKVGNSCSTNNISSVFACTNSIEDSSNPSLRRMKVDQQVREKMMAQIFERLQAQNKSSKEPRINNIRISLLKRLEDKYEKTQEVAQ